METFDNNELRETRAILTNIRDLALEIVALLERMNRIQTTKFVFGVVRKGDPPVVALAAPNSEPDHRIKVTPEVKEKIRVMYLEQREKQTYISKVLKLSLPTIQKVIKENGWSVIKGDS
jgi:hypothetical protein